MAAYYNEFDPYAAAWLRNLISAGHIAAGDVDERSIVDVSPIDLVGYRQCHFFAGIGGWPLALRLAGWPDDRPVWTGSCPCQPFSVAGKGEGQKDERHLWPEFFRLIRAARPDVVMGEQVAAAVGKNWLDGVCADLEGIGYAVGAVVVPACAVNAPHRRDRLWFVADREDHRRPDRNGGSVQGSAECQRPAFEPERRGSGALADADSPGLAQRSGQRSDDGAELAAAERSGALGDDAQRRRSNERCEVSAAGTKEADRGPSCSGALGQSDSAGRQPRRAAAETARYGGSVIAAGCDVGDADQSCEGEGREQRSRKLGGSGGDQTACALEHDPGERRREGRTEPEFWSGRATAACPSGWIGGHDGKARRVEPGVRLLAHGVPSRVAKLRAFGNAIVPQVAAEVIGAYMDCRP